jgi:hypothetical protein
LLLSGVGGDAIIDDLLPRVVLGLALKECVSFLSVLGGGVGELALKSKVPGAAALEKSSPVPTL